MPEESEYLGELWEIKKQKDYWFYRTIPLENVSNRYLPIEMMSSIVSSMPALSRVDTVVLESFGDGEMVLKLVATKLNAEVLVQGAVMNPYHHDVKFKEIMFHSAIEMSFKSHFIQWDPSETKENSMLRFALAELGEIVVFDPLKALPEIRRAFDPKLKEIFHQVLRKCVVKAGKDLISGSKEPKEIATMIRIFLPEYLSWDDSYFLGFLKLMIMVAERWLKIYSDPINGIYRKECPPVSSVNETETNCSTSFTDLLVFTS